MKAAPPSTPFRKRTIGTSTATGGPGLLRVHPKEAQLYGNLKQHLAQQFPEDIEQYCDGKDAFVKALENRAYAWYFTK
ncbi:MAG: GrpB family protein [Anaeromassilibacillus sp.]